MGHPCLRRALKPKVGHPLADYCCLARAGIFVATTNTPTQAKEPCVGHAPIIRNYCCGGWGVTVVVEVVSCFTTGGGAVVVVVTSVTGAGVVVVVVVSVTFG